MNTISEAGTPATTAIATTLDASHESTPESRLRDAVARLGRKPEPRPVLLVKPGAVFGKSRAERRAKAHKVRHAKAKAAAERNEIAMLLKRR